MPFPSTTIRHALAIYLLHQNFKDKRDAIEDAYIYLDNFIPDEEYNLFHSLQASMSIKGRLEERANSKHIKTLEIMNRLRTRTQKIRIRKEESIEELNALRRIMNLPDDISEMDMDDFSSTSEEVQELALNL